MSSGSDRPVYVLGSGRSGLAASRLAHSKGHRVSVFDESEGHDPFAGLENDDVTSILWVVSPGFAKEHPWCKRLRRAGADLIPEMEFAASWLEGEQVVVTGSLGKTSMVLFAADLLREAGYAVTVSGNIGTPVSQVALEQPKADFHVMEASSFQLESVREFRPARAVCLNLFENHLDRHQTLETYAAAKAKLFKQMASPESACWPEDFPVSVTTTAIRKAPSPLPELKDTRFAEGPLRENLAMMMAVLNDIPRVTPELIEKTAQDFHFPDHRLQTLSFPGWGQVIDDSKSTCFQATAAALQCTSGKTHVIMGGLDKDQSPDVLTDLFVKRNPSLYLFGTSGKKMQKAWQDSVDVCVLADSLEELMDVLFSMRTEKSEPVVFSPGCASFDQFDGFASRGKTFQRLFRRRAERDDTQTDFNPGTL